MQKLTLVLSSIIFLFHYSLDARELSIHPSSYTTESGSDGGQAVIAFTTQDQNGQDDDWDRYVEFLTPNITYSGTHIFTLPASIIASDISALELRVNYRGPLKSFQTWNWKIYDWKNRRWILLGNNTGAPGWTWQMLNFSLTGPFDNYVSNSKMKIQLSSNNAKDDADIDFENLVLTVPDEAPAEELGFWSPPLQTDLQVQFTGTLDTSLDVDVYQLDLFDTDTSTIDLLHSQGKKVICYINMGTWENWRPDAKSFPSNVKGRGNGWPGEKWLDIRKISTLGPLMESRMDLCKAKGFDAIEPDNINGYTNQTGFPLSYQDQINYNIYISQAAHARGLAIGLKNDLEQIPELVHHFDWVLNESCFYYGECALLLPFIEEGKAVFNIEYDLEMSAFCPQANAMNFNSMKKNSSLDSYRESCR